jgi:hypothetical protein
MQSSADLTSPLVSSLACPCTLGHKTRHMSASMFSAHPPAGRSGRRLVVGFFICYFVLWLTNAWIYRCECVSDDQRHAGTSAAHPAASADEQHASAHADTKPASENQDPAPANHDGTHAAHHHDRGLWINLYRSSQLFHFHDSHWPEIQSGWGAFARVAGAMFGLGLPLVMLGWFFHGGLGSWLHLWPWKKDFIVVVGSSDEASHLAVDIAHSHKVVQVVPGGTHATAEHGAHVLRLEGDLMDPRFWGNDVCIHRAAKVIIMAGEVSENIRLNAVLQKALDSNPRQTPLPVYLDSLDSHLKRGIGRLWPEGISGGVDLRYFNRYEIVARLLAMKYPLPAALAHERALPEHYIIVGFGQFGQNVMLKLVKMGQQVVRRQTADGPVFEVCKPRVTIVDRRGQKAVDGFERSYPDIRKTCTIDVVEADIADKTFLDLTFLKPDDAPAQCSIIFCLESEALVVTTILMMLDVCVSQEKDVDGIYFRSPRPDGVGPLLRERWEQLLRDRRQQVAPDAAPVPHLPIVTFASDAEVFCEDVVLNLSLDLMAEQIHATWQGVAKGHIDPKNPPPAANKAWAQLNEEEREGNREPADHMWSKVRSIGYELQPASFAGHGGGSQDAGTDSANLAADIEKHMEELASAEHYRWMTWRLINGWKYAEKRDNALKLHPNIVSYEALTEPEKDKDRVIVRILPQLLEIGRLRARKLNSATDSNVTT